MALPTPRDHDLYKLEYTLREDDSTQVTAFMLIGIEKQDFFLSIFINIYSFVKINPFPYCGPILLSGIMNWTKLQILWPTGFIMKRFLEIFLSLHTVLLC